MILILCYLDDDREGKGDGAGQGTHQILGWHPLEEIAPIEAAIDACLGTAITLSTLQGATSN